jgi:hypothetical protein
VLWTIRVVAILFRLPGFFKVFLWWDIWGVPGVLKSPVFS